MRMWPFTVGLFCWLILACLKAAAAPTTMQATNTTRTFTVHGVVMDVKPAEQIVVIRHEAIADYMDGMTMPFKAKHPEDLAGLHRGDTITFRLEITDTSSSVDEIAKTGTSPLKLPRITGSDTQTNATPAIQHAHPLLDYKFTNELGQAVSINDFRGQALAITFFYTRCPVPDFCPRLSKNFQEASAKLKARADAPTNWHFLSVSFDPQFDTPEMLKAYAGSYQADPAHWSFLTGPADKIANLAHAAGLTYQYEDGSFTHDFRTLILDANGQLQMVFPTSGNFSDQIVDQIIRAASVTNQLAMKKP